MIGNIRKKQIKKLVRLLKGGLQNKLKKLKKIKN